MKATQLWLTQADITTTTTAPRPGPSLPPSLSGERARARAQPPHRRHICCLCACVRALGVG